MRKEGGAGIFLHGRGICGGCRGMLEDGGLITARDHGEGSRPGSLLGGGVDHGIAGRIAEEGFREDVDPWVQRRDEKRLANLGGLEEGLAGCWIDGRKKNLTHDR